MWSVHVVGVVVVVGVIGQVSVECVLRKVDILGLTDVVNVVGV